MTGAQSSITFLTLTFFILLFSGILVFFWGKRIPGRGTWLLWGGFIAIVVGIGLDTGIFSKEEYHTSSWTAGWIGSKDDLGAISIGVLQEPLSIAICLFTVLVAGVLLLHRGFMAREPHPERVEAAIAISTSGIILSWISLTPWVTFCGLMLTLIGGFMALGSRWHSDDDAGIAIRFVWERAFGFLLGFFGACILATSRTALILNQPGVWTVSSAPPNSTLMGAGLLVSGLFIQMQPFPLLGWSVSRSAIYLPLRILLNQIFPGWAAFSLLLKMHPFLTTIGLFPLFGWVALISSLLTIVTGLFQKDWRSGLGLWLAAGLSLAVALLALSGPYASMAMLIGMSMGALALASAGSVLSSRGPGRVEAGGDEKGATRSIWLKITLFLGASAGTGVIGFVSADGGLRWIVSAFNSSNLALLHGLVFFFFALLGWKLTWNLASKKSLAVDAPWTVVLLPLIWILLSFAFLWTGTITGHVLAGAPDRIGDSAFDFFFGPTPLHAVDLGEDISAPTLYWGALILAFLTAYWTAGRKEDRWLALAHWMPRTGAFLANGYGVDSVLNRLARSLIWMGKKTEQLVDQKIWMDWIPRGVSYGTRMVSGSVNSLDSWLSSSLGEGLRKSVEVPGKFLQFIQTGDVRWYLFFAVSSGFALLIHFLNS